MSKFHRRICLFLGDFVMTFELIEYLFIDEEITRTALSAPDNFMGASLILSDFTSPEGNGGKNQR